MKAIVYRGPHQVAVSEVDEPKIEAPNDAIVRITTSSWIVSHEVGLDDAPDAYERFDEREDGYTKVLLHPGV